MQDDHVCGAQLGLLGGNVGRQRSIRKGPARGLVIDEPLRAAVTQVQLGQTRESLALHHTECWRAELIAEDDAATRWAAEHPQTDLQQLRSLIRAARKDASLVPEKRSGRAYRELFQFIKQHQGAEPAAAA